MTFVRNFIFTALFFTTAAYAAVQPSVFEKANDAYKKGDFKEAVRSYQQLAASGGATAALYFNLGNAALRSGEKGQALVYYERARKATPRDSDLLWNIRVLKGTLKDKIEDRSFLPAAAWRVFLDKWTADETAFCLTFFLALAALLAASGFFNAAGRARVRPLIGPVWVVVFAVGLVLAGKAWETKDPRAVVLDKETAAYYGPSEQESRAFVVHEGAEGRVADESGDWYNIVLLNKNTGWIRKNACEIV